MALTYNGKANRRSDGKAVTVVVPSGQTWQAGTPQYAQGWHGFAIESGVAGDVVELEVEQSVWEVDLGSGITGAKGDIIYITTATGVLSGTSGTGKVPFGKVVLAKDSNNIAWVRHMENS
jgi:hypothetical protein